MIHKTISVFYFKLNNAYRRVSIFHAMKRKTRFIKLLMLLCIILINIHGFLRYNQNVLFLYKQATFQIYFKVLSISFTKL